MSKKRIDKPVIEPWDDFNEIDLSKKKRLFSDEHREKIGSYRRDKQSEWIAKAKKIHGDKFDYSKVRYVNSRTKVIIICPIHGEFLQQPYGHLQQYKNGCIKCGYEDRTRQLKGKKRPKEVGEKISKKLSGKIVVDVDFNEVGKLRKQGKSYSEICKILKVSTTTLRYRMRENNIKFKPIKNVRKNTPTLKK